MRVLSTLREGGYPPQLTVDPIFLTLGLASIFPRVSVADHKSAPVRNTLGTETRSLLPSGRLSKGRGFETEWCSPPITIFETAILSPPWYSSAPKIWES